MAEEKTPNTEAIKEAVEKSNKFVDWIVEVLRSKNRTTKLLLLDVLLFTAFNPVFFPKILELFGIKQLPNHYTLYFWLVIGAVFVAAVVAAWRARPKDKPLRDLSESRAIKGLLPYTKDDAALFARLQREHDLTECLQAINDTSFRFGVLSGESGAGKSSFLQAGLWAEFEERKLRCVYVKFSDLDPFESVKRACLKHLPLPDDIADTADFLTLLDTAARQDASPIVLLFDQFEQFFVHRKRKKDREPFVQALARWFIEMQSSPVKILLCIRGDFLDRLNELQKAMRYSLSPAQSFRLERFEPDQATEVFCFLAEKESLEYDRKFISEMTRQELADTEDGLISPVDIQVLAWMIAGQPVRDGRAFNRTTFQKLGGVDGLLERYLTRALAVRETEARRQAAIKVLLALTDLERNTRAGALNVEALRQKLGGDINDAEMKEAVAWLARSDVRLISPSSESEEEKFELAHERLIPALRRLAGKELTETDRADQLLDRRANEWLGNGRHSRYLFSWSELRLINKHRRFVTWGKERQAKEELLAVSQRRFRLRYAAVGLAILLAVTGWIGWNSNAWQTYLIKRDLRDYGNSLKDDQALTVIAQAFAYAGDSQFALQVVERIKEQISYDLSKARALGAVAKSYVKLGDKEKASGLLVEAMKTAESIRDGFDKNSELTDIVESYAKLGETTKDGRLLSQALKAAAGRITSDFALIAIAESYAKLGDKERASRLLSEALKMDHSAHALRAIAESYAKLGDKEKASGLLSEALKTAEGMSDDFSNADALCAIAESYAKLGDKEKASRLLSEALKTVEGMSDDSSKADALRAIAESYAKLGDKEKASGLLSEALKTVEGMSNYSFKADALRAIAESYAKLGDKEKASRLLSEALKTVERNRADSFNANLHAGLSVSNSKADTLRALTASYAKFSESSNDRTLYDKTFSFIEGLGSDDDRDKILESILSSKLAVADVGRLRALTSHYSSEAGKAKALALILMAVSHPELIGKEKESEDDKDK